MRLGLENLFILFYTLLLVRNIFLFLLYKVETFYALLAYGEKGDCLSVHVMYLYYVSLEMDNRYLLHKNKYVFKYLEPSIIISH